MKISITELQGFFGAPLPPVAEVADAFTFHTWEIDGIERDVLDVKVLPNRQHDAKDAEGIARQLGAILDLPLKPEFEKVTPGTTQVTTSLAQINAILGASFTKTEVEDVFRRLRLTTEWQGDTLTWDITPPADRTDLTIPVDIAEEVGQILGYDRVPAVELAPDVTPADQARYRGIERMKDQLVEQGYTEVSTQSFAQKGDVELANPLDKTRPFLRTSLEDNLEDALTRAKQYAPLLYAPGERPKLFEVGTVFTKEGEHLELRMTEPVAAWGENAATVDNLSVAKLEDYGKDYLPVRQTLSGYAPFSLYPFITRDIALWAPARTDPARIHELINELIQEQGGALLVRVDQFDRFEKEGRVSYGFRLVFQSMDRTLTDDEVATIMDNLSSALTAQSYETR
ncbi:hypothetical protein COU19_00115 [Candidatus Kaiserbacteria bacterium CG10_big_fil_rev_8_21_14_0_10_56_12]|uniref:phenylalanine--tRNA ligase n=1 Tax=Candidatus Kaiserbacteria bacterium CG10_big_fil_rev_8_21_14_0_10_56_12 TaxID=1974611 RepID=A0A2H0UAP2_9BACT|nr:MAG: hypothetical protein COU19_00115 [Candidatus Kaiserbacteria bacterium CG10_big_fil_rev_8_21_14_0_10_56_12]